MEKLKYFCLITFAFVPSLLFAKPYYGATFSYALMAKEPPDLHGFQFFLNYDPDCIKWRKFNIYFNVGYAHFWVNTPPHNSVINIYSFAPVIHYSFKRRGLLWPYLEISIGLSYLDHTRLADRNLGIHFAFQDQIGVGVFLGTQKQFSIGIHTVHYSNARLSSNNSGITVPVLFDVSYWF